MRHYFLTYKTNPGSQASESKVEIAEVYGREEALETIRASFEDYKARYAI